MIRKFYEYAPYASGGGLYSSVGKNAFDKIASLTAEIKQLEDKMANCSHTFDENVRDPKKEGGWMHVCIHCGTPEFTTKLVPDYS